MNIEDEKEKGMHNLIKAVPLYNFIRYCNESGLEKTVLDCGAGGSNPPLSLFWEFGYKTYGIELSEEQLLKANSFCEKYNMNLNIKQGDMTKLSFENNNFSFLFSYNTSVHILKKYFNDAIDEFYRVLKKDGFCYINFLSEECDSFGQGTSLEKGEFLNIEDGEEVIYVHYKEKEIEDALEAKGFEIIYKEKRIINRINGDEESKSSSFDYIVKK